MITQTSSAEIGQYGYAHYKGEPVTPGKHSALRVPQPISDGWEYLCSCGEWRAFASFYEFSTYAAIHTALSAEFAYHVGTAGVE